MPHKKPTAMSEVLLKKIKLGVVQVVSPEVAESLEVITHAAGFMTEALVKAIIALPGEEVKKTHRRVVTFRVPATWFDHWKATAAPRWLARRWPPTYVDHERAVTFRVDALYPKAPLLWPTMRRDEIRYKLEVAGDGVVELPPKPEPEDGRW